MKKNKMMRLASGLLVAVLITTSTISGTFAKYVTEDSAQDSARVAKFGVVVTADGSLFENAYLHAPVDAGDSTATVVAKDSKDVVAPGTHNADNAFKFSITGTPEVDVKVDVVVTEATEDVYLKAGKYPDMTTGSTEDFVKVDEDYYPVKYTLKKGGSVYTYGDPVVTAKDMTLAELKAALESISTAKVDANKDLGTLFGTYEITWAWDFDDAGAGTYDRQDTLLGDLAAGMLDLSAYYTVDPADPLYDAAVVKSLTEDTHFNLNTGFKVTVSVEQID